MIAVGLVSDHVGIGGGGRAGHRKSYGISIRLFQLIDLFLASDSEPAINVAGEAGH